VIALDFFILIWTWSAGTLVIYFNYFYSFTMIAAIKSAPLSVRPRSLTSQKRASHVVAAARDSWLPGSDFPKRTSNLIERLLMKCICVDGSRAVGRCSRNRNTVYLPLSGGDFLPRPRLVFISFHHSACPTH